MRTAYSLRLIRAATQPPPDAAPGAPATPPAAAPRLLPHPAVLGSLLGSALLTNAAGLVLGTPQSSLAQHALHVLLGGACLLGVAAAVVHGEREMIAGVAALRREKSE